MTRWAILTGEYPAQCGGVSDYTAIIAAGLVAAGDEVTVYAPSYPGTALSDTPVSLRRLPDHFGPRGLIALDQELSTRLRPDRLLVQYVPQAFGWKGMNLPFAAWLASRANRVAPVWVMFHEVFAGVGPVSPLRHLILTRTTWTMARLVAGAAERIFVSIPAWRELLRRVCPRARRAEWSPIPSNLPNTADSKQTAAVREGIVPGPGAVVLGHFGTFGVGYRSRLADLFASLLHKTPERVALFIGRGSIEFQGQFVVDHPSLARRSFATGELQPQDAAAHLAACDVLIQPYPDGASSRRTSLMSGLALSVPTVTNTGFLSEAIWGTESEGVTVAASPDLADLVGAAEAILALRPAERVACGRAATAWYNLRFAPEHTVARLRAATPVPQQKTNE